MRTPAIFLATSLLLTLSACNASPDSGSNNADDFAARINGAKPAAPAATPVNEPLTAPTVAAPLPGAVPGPYVPGTMTDPNSSICAANLMEPFIGQPADEATRNAILEAATGAESVRFVMPGSAVVNPDPTSARLSIMIDNLNIIRDARCG
ncbi:hypothetical protein EH31_01145 [Erythrobacter longus]|uniref:Peptidase inhibitor I78 n=1 Tax=Erythrobacter longus TaxID=1044 RepID=A0A074N071_ERYLO|nr:I78 family peptidase inhibitor [Erythrobacter longus]KEO91297.1 hypothetical protein EH31_01145 [Erythrobacter longus]